MFSLATSLTQILITVAVFTGVNSYYPIKFDEGEKEPITYQLYIALAALDFIVIIFSIVLLYGNERTDESRARSYILPWLILIPFYVIYESAINIFYFYNQFNDEYDSAYPLGRYSNAIGFSIVPLVYWVIKEVILFISFVFLIVRYQSLHRHHSVQYVQEINGGGGCHDYCAGPVIHTPSLPTPVTFYAPSPPACNSSPAPPTCTSCSGGCSSNRCSKCNLVQPSYGYASSPTANVAKSGWITNVYSGR
jgi:uncharacterized membrane protein